MYLNTLKPAKGSTSAAKRCGRGIGSGLGKTGGRGHKGQKSRSGGKIKPGFEGGQMPLQRRLPKYGFNSRLARITDEIRLGDLAKINADIIDRVALRNAGLINGAIKRVKIIATGELNKALTIKKGLSVTKGARAAIEAAGGKIEE